MNDPRQQAATWFVRLRSQSDAQAQTEFHHWLAASPQHAAEYQAFEALWNDLGDSRRSAALAGAMEQNRGHSRLRRGLCGLLMIVVSAAGWQTYRLSPQTMELHTAVGERQDKTLRDGTLLQLNAATRLSVDYRWSQRHLTLLQGEALFDVARNTRRPFVIDSGVAKITVRGTRFVVNRLPDRLRVSVDHGQVEVASSKRQEIWQVTAGQVVEVNADGHLQRLDQPASNAFAFTRGSLVFEQADLSEIAASLSRYRQRPLSAGSHYPTPRISAVVQQSDVEDFIKALPSIAPVRLDEDAQGMRISPRR